MSFSLNVKPLEGSFCFDPGVTMKPEPPGSQSTYPSFWKEYYALPRTTWEQDVTNRIVKLMKLPDNWDGYNSPPLRNDVWTFALTVLRSLMQPQTPTPQVVPSTGGGVQLEWHEKDIDLEVNFSAPYQCELWVEDHRTGTCVSKVLTNEFSEFKDAIAFLTTR
jgi:hypothetical protein